MPLLPVRAAELRIARQSGANRYVTMSDEARCLMKSNCLPAVLLIAKMDDAQSALICWALRTLGAKVIQWDWSSFPARGRSHIELRGATRTEFSFDGFDHTTEFTSVVYRRPALDCRPSPRAHPADAELIRESSLWLMHAVIAALRPTQWVNYPPSSIFARDKIVQLLSAASVGFNIPHTLFTNDPDRVYALRAACEAGIIHKAPVPASWVDSTGTAHHAETAFVTDEDYGVLRENISLCPGIYQEFISKKSDVRVVVMGSSVCATRILSQETAPTTDWRIASVLSPMRMEELDLPPTVVDRCLQLCRKLDCTYAAIDLAETQSGEFVFFELNEAGNLIWDDYSKPMKLVCRYCAFLCRESITAFNSEQLYMNEFLRSEEYRRLITGAHSTEYRDDV